MYKRQVLDFPIMADYAVLTEGERLIYATHGHVYLSLIHILWRTWSLSPRPAAKC